ncbi:hypothetical protein B296_00049412, partial [Ensete ventricosum]
MGSIKEELQLTPEEDEEACMYAVELASGPIMPMTVGAAAELGIFEILVKAGPTPKLSAADIAAQMPTQNPQAAVMVDRILRLLAAYNVVRCTVETGADGRPLGKYGPAPVCKYLAKNEDGAYGMTAFEYYRTNARSNKVFNEAMRNHSTILTKKLLDIYRGFEGVKVLVDVGGGVGGIISMIVAKYLHIKAINFDLPHVISEAPPIAGPPRP